MKVELFWLLKLGWVEELLWSVVHGDWIWLNCCEDQRLLLSRSRLSELSLWTTQRLRNGNNWTAFMLPRKRGHIMLQYIIHYCCSTSFRQKLLLLISANFVDLYLMSWTHALLIKLVVGFRSSFLVLLKKDRFLFQIQSFCIGLLHLAIGCLCWMLKFEVSYCN